MSGWPLTGWIAALLVGGSALLFASAGIDEDAVRLWLRATARTSLALFLFAFVARPLRDMWRVPASAWLLRNRRYVGVGFGVSHTLHLIALSWLATGWSESFGTGTAMAVILGGGAGYVFVGAMLATSFDVTARWLGPTRWKRLHRTGLWVTWLVFVYTFSGLLRESPAYWLPIFALAAGVGLRVASFARQRRPARAAAGPA